MQIDAIGKLQVLINGKESTLQWPEKAVTKFPINWTVCPLVSFPWGLQGRVELQGKGKLPTSSILIWSESAVVAGPLSDGTGEK